MDKRKDHQAGNWICLEEGPIGNNRWSYSCDYCMIRIEAALMTSEIETIGHLSDLADSFEQWYRLRGHHWIKGTEVECGPGCE